MLQAEGPAQAKPRGNESRGLGRDQVTGRPGKAVSSALSVMGNPWRALELGMVRSHL